MDRTLVLRRKPLRIGMMIMVMTIALMTLSGCINLVGEDAGGSSDEPNSDGGGEDNAGSSEFTITALSCEKSNLPTFENHWEVTFTWQNLPSEASNLWVTQSSTAILDLTPPKDVIVTEVASEPQDVTLTVQAMPFAIAEATDTISCPTAD